MFRRAAGLLFIGLAVAAVSCGDDGTTVATPAGLIVVSGDNQIGTVGEALSSQLTVRVVDGNDDAISGVDVTFATGSGSVSPATATTNDQGQASTTWTLGTTSGTQEATASTDGLSETFTATAEAGNAVSLSITPASPETLTAIDATTDLSTDAEDQYGNGVTAVTWTSSDDGIATVDDGGIVTAVANGTVQIAAASGSVADTVDVTVSQQAADVAITADTSRLAWSAMIQLAGSAVDANGYDVPGATVSWSSVDPSIAAVDAAGMVTGEGIGTAGIIAAVDTLADTLAVTVTPVPEASMVHGLEGGCLLDETGAAYCWGSNWAGQLGDGTSSASNEPVAVAGGHTFVALGTAAYAHYCALSEDGTAYCWGYNGYGQLGDGTTTNANTPVSVSGGHSFRGISTAFYHTCAIDDTGDAYCWGDNGSGQLGDGTTTGQTTPTAVSTSLTFDAVDVGGWTSCALDGTDAYCWGRNDFGQVGDGTTATPRTTPITVAGGHEFASISSGYQHGCGMTTAGAPYCWGFNGYGQIGDGTTTDVSSPTAVSDLATVEQISADAYTSCAVASGDAYCWGYNAYGALGDGTTTGRSTPSMVTGGINWSRVLAGYHIGCGVSSDDTPYCWGYTPYVGDGTTLDQPTPTSVLGGNTFTDIDAGNGMTCATTGNESYCWGNNSNGELGQGDFEPRSEPAQITTVSLDRVAAGTNHACGLTSSGDAYCWGDNGNGQLGDGTTTDSDVPVAVNAAFTFSEIMVGTSHTCGIRASNSAAYCWGNNGYGQLGDGTTTQRTSPSLVSGGHSFTGMAVGDYHTCGVAGTGTTYCWGANWYGQVGDGTTTHRSAPTAISGSVSLVEVTAGGFHTCGLTVGNLAYCWGSNGYGQLGDATTTNRTTPTAVSGSVLFDLADAGRNHTCGVGSTGTTYCWGRGASGQLGNGSTANQNQPTPIQGGYTMATASAGANHSCGITTGGDSYCWGYAGAGALGNGQSTFSDPVMVAGNHTLPYSPYIGADPGFRWGTGGSLGEPIRYTSDELQAIMDRIEQIGLPTGDPMLEDEGGEIQRR